MLQVEYITSNPEPRRKESNVFGRNIRLPDPPDKFYRCGALLPQEQFSAHVRLQFLVPVRAEMGNNYITSFLAQLNQWRGFNDTNRVGVTFLINDNAPDRKKRPGVFDDNIKAAQYLSLLMEGDRINLNYLDIPDEHKQIAGEVLDGRKVEVRYDHLHHEEDQAHYGKLRQHLFHLAHGFKNDDVPDEEMIVHPSDIDTTYTPAYLRKLQQFYSDPSHQSNIGNWDYVPGEHEDAYNKDINRQLLLDVDKLRLHRNGLDLRKFIQGKNPVGNPAISGRLSYFFKDGELRIPLSDYKEHEDYALGEFMRDDKSNNKGTSGEVYYHNRSRDESVSGYRTDGGYAHKKLMEIRKGELPIEAIHGNTINLLEAADIFIDEIEAHMLEIPDAADNSNGHAENFTKSAEYTQFYSTALQKEKAKVRIRRIRLRDYIAALTAPAEAESGKDNTIDPFVRYFGDEIEDMKRQLDTGKDPQDLANEMIDRFDYFFDHENQIHLQIARIQALMRYATFHNLKIA